MVNDYQISCVPFYDLNWKEMDSYVQELKNFSCALEICCKKCFEIFDFS